jgi:hypothetical protein
VANPGGTPENLKPWPKGVSGNPGGRRKQPDIDALDKLIKEMAAEPSIARTWLTAALGNVKAGIPPNPALFKLLIEYRNGRVPQDLNLTYADSDEAKPRIEVPDVDQRPKRRARGRKAKASGSNGDVPS